MASLPPEPEPPVPGLPQDGNTYIPDFSWPAGGFWGVGIRSRDFPVNQYLASQLLKVAEDFKAAAEQPPVPFTPEDS